MKYIMTVVLLTSFLVACNHFETADLDSQFIYFQSAKLKNGNRSGLNKGVIPDLKVTVDGTTLGLLRLPKKLAFNVENESAGLIILPAVPMDGKLSNTTVYPMIAFKEMFVPKNSLATDTFNLEFDYKKEVVFNTVEGFEITNTISNDIDDNPNTKLVRTDETSYEGEFCGKIHLSKEEPIVHVGALEKLVVEKVFKGIFLELTYKNDVELFVGLSALNTSNEVVNKYKIYLSPKEEWNTVFVDLTDDYLSAGSAALNIRLAFGAELDTDKRDSGDIFIDNVKLLYY